MGEAEAEAEAEADAPVPVAVPVAPETPVGSLGCSAEVVVDSELRLVLLPLLMVVSVAGTEVDVNVRIGPPGLLLLTERVSESDVRGSETTLAMAAVGPRMRRRALRVFIFVLVRLGVSLNVVQRCEKAGV